MAGSRRYWYACLHTPSNTRPPPLPSPAPAASAHALDMLLGSMYASDNNVMVAVMGFCAVSSSAALPFLLGAARIHDTVCSVALEPDIACTIRAFGVATVGSLVMGTCASIVVLTHNWLGMLALTIGAFTFLGTLLWLILNVATAGMVVVILYVIYAGTGMSMGLVWAWVGRGRGKHAAHAHLHCTHHVCAGSPQSLPRVRNPTQRNPLSLGQHPVAALVHHGAAGLVAAGHDRGQ